MHLAMTKQSLLYVLSLLSLTFFSALPVSAATELDLYSEAVVVSQTATRKEQNQAIKKAFQRLLVRVSGVEDVLDNKAVIAELDDGASYLATFRFEASDAFFTNVLGERVPTKTMILQFDKRAVDSLLVKNRLPVWGAKRPDVLVLIADRLDGNDHILADGEDSAEAQALQKITRERGIPYLLPIMDLTDSLAFDFADVYGLFSSDISAAAARYHPDAILTGRLSRLADGTLQADWLVLFKSERLRLASVQGTFEEVIGRGVNFVSKRLSEQYALILDPLMVGAFTIEVTDVKTLDDFAALEKYLKSINLITQVTLSRYSVDSVQFRVELSGDMNQLADIIALDKLLVPVAQSSLEAQLDNVLHYRWQH